MPDAAGAPGRARNCDDVRGVGMGGGFYGADVAQLRDLAAQFGAAADALDRDVRLLSHRVAATPQWRGRDAEAFRREWSASLRPALLGTSRRLGDAAGALLRNAAEQERASAAGGPARVHGARPHASARGGEDWSIGSVLRQIEGYTVEALRRAPHMIPWAFGWPGVVRAVAQAPDAIDDFLFNTPVATEVAAGLLPYAAQAGAFAVAGLPPFLALGGGLLVHALSGGRWPTTDFERAVDGLLEVTGRVGLLRDSGEFHVAPVPADRVPSGAAAPADVAGILRQQQVLSASDAQIQVVRRDQPDGTTAWVVQIPGTQDWSPVRGDNPIDLATNLALMAGRDSLAEHQVVAAMEAAGIQPGDPVMLTGHSQGGITAAALASDPALADRFSIRSVVTAGAPIARFDIPHGVDVLALEHAQDVVPMLEGKGNPPSWITVEHNLSMDDLAAAGREREPSLEAAHDPGVYATTGAIVDRSADPRISAWRSSNTVFLSGGAVEVARYSVAPGPVGGGGGGGW